MADDPAQSPAESGPRPAIPSPPRALEELANDAAIDELRRAYRLVIGSEGAYWERHLISGRTWYSDNFFTVLDIEPGAGRQQINSFIHPEDKAEFDRCYEAAIEQIGPLRVDVRYRHRSGHHSWARIQGRVWAGADGRAERLIGMVSDVDAEKNAQLELQRLAEQVNRALDASLEVHFEHSPDDGSFYMSSQINRLVGYPADRLPPSHDEFLAWAHPDDAPEMRAIAERAKSAQGPWHCDCRLRLADGSYRWFRARGRTERLPDGRIRISGMIGDIHEQRLAREELIAHRQRLQLTVEERTASLESALAEAKRQRAEAERANEAKSTFLAHMSHEIRTPLNGLLGLNELALREARSAQQRRYLKLALQSGAGLLDMLNGVLDFSRLSAGGTPSKLEAFDLAETLATSLRRVMPQARGKGLGMMYDYLGPVTLVIGDEQRLQQIAANLLTNAVKYTERGYVAVRAVVRATDGPQCCAEIEFRDTGPGMSPDVAARIFDPFVQGDESLARKHGGAGLGLSIALGLTEAMGGDLRVESAPGQGSCFRLTLPLQMQPGAQPMEQAPEPGTAWLVYKHQVPAQWLATRLLRLNWQSEILTGFDALLARAAAAGPAGSDGMPDLVVLAEAALEATTDLHQLRERLPQTPIVLLIRPDWNQPAVEAAARALDIPLVFMPLTPGSLIELTVLHGRRSAAAADSAFPDLHDGVAPGADVLVAEDNPVNQLIITEMVAALGLRARLATNGAEAIASCREKQPDLLLMDLQMPVLDGIEATRQLLEMQRIGEIAAFPIVALTAHATPQDRERCINAGMQGYLTKPVSLGQLRTELGRWIRL